MMCRRTIGAVSLVLVLCCVRFGTSVPLGNALYYYRPAMPLMMYQPQTMYAMYQNQRLRSQHRSAGVTTFATGNTVATGTFLKDPVPAEPEQEEVHSFAEAYPDQQYPAENEIPEEFDSTPGVELELPSSGEADEVATSNVAPVAPVPVPDKRKKVTVQLDSDEGDDEQTAFGTRRGGSGGTGGGAMFPVTFGSTHGGAIAIANSYSTGKGGSATSHATAYGSPAQAELRRAPVPLRNRPAKLRKYQH